MRQWWGMGMTGCQGVMAPLSFYIWCFLFVCLETESLYKIQSVFKFLLPQPPGCWFSDVLSVVLVSFNRDTSIFRASRVGCTPLSIFCSLTALFIISQTIIPTAELTPRVICLLLQRVLNRQGCVNDSVLSVCYHFGRRCGDVSVLRRS